jgi:hypothetical protein
MCNFLYSLIHTLILILSPYTQSIELFKKHRDLVYSWLTKDYTGRGTL